MLKELKRFQKLNHWKQPLGIEQRSCNIKEVEIFKRIVSKMERLSYGLVQLLNIFGHNIFRIEKGQFFGVSFWDYIFVHNLHFANLDTILSIDQLV